MKRAILVVAVSCVPWSGVGFIGSPASAEEPSSAKDLDASKANFEAIGKALDQFNKENSVLPTNVFAPASREAKGGRLPDRKALLSWRVAILPALGEEALYTQIKLNEPWDSDHNKKFAGKMPKVFTAPRGRAKAGETYYQMFVGKNAYLEPDGQLVRLMPRYEDDYDKTFLVAEAAEPVNWMRPADIPFDGKTAPRLGGVFDGRFHALMGDGKVLRFKKDADPKTLLLLINRRDGMFVKVDGVLDK